MSAALDWWCSKTPRGESRPFEYMARTKSVVNGSRDTYVAVADLPSISTEIGFEGQLTCWMGSIRSMKTLTSNLLNKKEGVGIADTNPYLQPSLDGRWKRTESLLSASANSVI